jgi:AAA domain/Nuclease-related domain/UvrD-like helicase C-terminal domain
MAQIIPVAVPANATLGEKTLFKILTSLPDDDIVYYDARIRHRYADLVVISPRLGVLMIEVKDWRAGTISSASNDTVELRLRAHNKMTTHPVKQARAHALALKDEIESRLEGRVLLKQDGPHRGGVSFPIGHIAVLSNISSHDIELLNLCRVFEPAYTLTRDSVSVMLNLKGAELEKFLSPYFRPKFEFAPLDKLQIDQLRGIIHPHIVVRSSTQKLRDHHGADKGKFISLLRVLDSKQEQKARNIGPGHRLLFGVAGSGKTTILIARAKYLAEQHQDQQGLVLCFNRPLAAYLHTQLADYSNLTVTTFHQLAFRFGVDWKDEEGFAKRLKAAIRNGARHYDFVLIDEAQDFDQDWFGCVVDLLRDQNDGDLFITGDGSQGLYRRRKGLSWKSEGVHAQGRTEYLDENYRNAPNIYQLATRFAGASAFGEIEGEHNALHVDQSRAVASGGGSISIIREKDRATEISRVVNLVSQLLTGKWEDEGRVRSINPQIECTDIGIIYPRHTGLETLITKSLIPRIKNECKVPVVWISDPKKHNRSDFSSAIRVHTIHHAKGLQYRAVIFFWADLLPFAQSDDPEQNRSLFYVGLTRASQFLAIIHSGHSSLVKECTDAINGPKKAGS